MSLLLLARKSPAKFPPSFLWDFPYINIVWFLETLQFIVFKGGSFQMFISWFRDFRGSPGKSHPWTNASVGGNFRKTFRTIGPCKFPQEKVWTKWLVHMNFPEICRDQWRSKWPALVHRVFFPVLVVSSVKNEQPPSWTIPFQPPIIKTTSRIHGN